MSGEGEYDQEKFERSNGSTLCRRMLLFGKCSVGEDCRWKHNIEHGDVAPLCRDHFLRKNFCPRVDSCPLSHVSSGVNLPSNVLKEAQVGESRPTLTQMPRAASGAENDSFSRQHVSKQQRDAAMASLRVDNRGSSKVKSVPETHNFVMNGGVSLIHNTGSPQPEKSTDCPPPRPATDPNITVGRLDKDATTSTGVYHNLGSVASSSRYSGSGGTFHNGQANYVNDPRGGSAPMNHSQQSRDSPISHRPESSRSYNPSLNRNPSYQGTTREGFRPPIYQNDVMPEQRVMNYDQPPQPIRASTYYPHRSNHPRNTQNGSIHGNGNGFQEYSDGGMYQNQFPHSNAASPHANNTGGSQQSFRPGSQNSINPGPVGGSFSVSASQTDPTPSNRNEPKPAVNIQNVMLQVMRNTAGNITAPRDVIFQKRIQRGRGSFRGFGRPVFSNDQRPNSTAAGNFNTSHMPGSIGPQATIPQGFNGNQPWGPTHPNINFRQEHDKYNRPMGLAADRFEGGPSNTGGYAKNREFMDHQQFETPETRFFGPFGTDTNTHDYAELPIDRGFQSGYSMSRNKAINNRNSASGIPNLGQERPSQAVSELLGHSSVGGGNRPSDTAVRMSPYNHNWTPDLDARSVVNYQIESGNKPQDREPFHPTLNGDTNVALVNRSSPNHRVGNSFPPINNKYQPKYTGNRTPAGPSRIPNNNHAIQCRDPRNFHNNKYNGRLELGLCTGSTPLRVFQSKSDLGDHEPATLHESSDSSSDSSGRFTPELAQPADLPIRHSPEPTVDRSAVRLYWEDKRAEFRETNPNPWAGFLPSMKKERSSDKKTPSRNKAERTRSEGLILAANLQKPGQFTKSNAHVAEENSVKNGFKPLLPPLITPISPLTPTSSLPTPALPTPTPSLPAPAPTPSLPTPVSLESSLPTPASPESSQPTPASPESSQPTPASQEPSLLTPATPTPSLPTSEAPTPSPPAPALSTLSSPESSLPTPVPPVLSLSAPVSLLPSPPLPSPQPSASVKVPASKPNPRSKKRKGKAKSSAPVTVPESVPEPVRALVPARVSAPIRVPENVPISLPPPERVEQNAKMTSPHVRVADERPESKAPTTPQTKTCWLCEGHHEGPCEANGLVSSKVKGKRDNDDDTDTWDFQGINKQWSDDGTIGQQMTRKAGKNKDRVKKAHVSKDLHDQDDNGGVPLGKFTGTEFAQSTKPGSKKREKKKAPKEGVALNGSVEREEPTPEEPLKTPKSYGQKSVMVRADGNHIGRYFEGGDSGVRKLSEDILTTIFSYLADGLMPEDQMETKNVHIGNSFKFDNSFTTTRYRRLGAVLRSCHYWRYLGQRIVCKYVNLNKLHSFRRFVRTISEDEELGNAVRAIKVNIHGGASYMAHDRRLSKHVLVEMPKVSDLAQLFTRMMQSCPQLQVLSVNMHGAIMGFNLVFEKFPMMREIQIKDDKSKGVVAQNIWTNLSNNYPNLENFRIFHSQENGATSFDSLKISPKFFQLKGVNEIVLKALTMERSPELSDKSLIALFPRLKNLTTLVIVDCKLVTSGGLARAIEKLPNPSQITRLIYFVWVDPFGKSTADEMTYTRSHLCTTIRNYCTNVSYLCWKPYRICGDFWKDSNFHSLERCRIEPMSFRDCDKDVDDHSKFTEAYKQAREEERLPKLEEDRVFFDFYF